MNVLPRCFDLRQRSVMTQKSPINYQARGTIEGCMVAECLVQNIAERPELRCGTMVPRGMLP